ncbi:MAG: hypothetical protein LBL83_13890 [Clostridiales bacterium]|nr:hypothetical protein [Clostridiales bacterium]
MKSLFEYLHTRVRIKTKDGRTLEGDVDGVASGLETESGYDEISLEYPEWQEIVDESEIASIEALAAYRPPVGQLRAAK